VITSAAAIGITAVLEPIPQTITRAAYDAALQRLEAMRAGSQARCNSMDGAEAGLCLAQLRANDRVKAAELEAAYRRTEHAARNAQRARIDARYEIDRARCEGVKGFRKDKCLITAHAAKGRALLEAAAPYELRYSF
jgi:hypothetical protein